MLNRSLFCLIVASFFCSALPAQMQPAENSIQLPDGNGKETVKSACTKCHTLERVVDAGFTRKGGN